VKGRIQCEQYLGKTPRNCELYCRKTTGIQVERRTQNSRIITLDPAIPSRFTADSKPCMLMCTTAPLGMTKIQSCGTPYGPHSSLSPHMIISYWRGACIRGKVRRYRKAVAAAGAVAPSASFPKSESYRYHPASF
jgi:hypothetical protein